MRSTTANKELVIDELADRFGLAPRVLRHWESMGLLAPKRRVNGQRCYTSADLTRVAMILRGKEAGFPLEQIRGIAAASDPAERHRLLLAHKVDLERRIAQAQAAKELVECALNCDHEDLLACPNFQRTVADRIPPESL